MKRRGKFPNNSYCPSVGTLVSLYSFLMVCQSKPGQLDVKGCDSANPSASFTQASGGTNETGSASFEQQKTELDAGSVSVPPGKERRTT